MAIYFQPYNPWREQLAAGILTPLLNNWIQRGYEKTDNAKINQIRGNILQELRNLTSPQTNSLSAPVSPSSVIGAETLPPIGAMNSAQQTQSRLPTLEEINSAIISNLANSNVNPQTIQDLMNPYINSVGTQRMNDLKNSYASSLGNASSFDEQVNLLTRAVMEGAATDDTLKTLAGYAQFRQPYYRFSEMDTGDQKYLLSQNPLNGQVTPAYSQHVAVSPNTSATVGTQRDIASMQYGTQRDIASMQDATRRYIADQTNDIASRTLQSDDEEKRYQRENPNLITITDEDGTVYFANPKTGKIVQAVNANGQKITNSKSLENLKVYQDASGGYVVIDPAKKAAYPVNHAGQQVMGPLKNTPNNNKDLTRSQEIQLEQSYREAQALSKEISNLQGQLAAFADTPEDPTYKHLVAEIEKREQRLEQLRQLQQGIITPKEQQVQQVIPMANSDVQPPATQSQTPSAISEDMSEDFSYNPSWGAFGSLIEIGRASCRERV